MLQLLFQFPSAHEQPRRVAQRRARLVDLDARAVRELVLHGRETGRLVRLPHGEFVEVHEPISPEKAWLLTSHEQLAPLELPEFDSAGVKRPQALKNKIRNRISRAVAVAVPKATESERKELEGHH